MVRLVTSLFAAGLALTALAHAETADDRFKALYEKEWIWRQEQFPGQDDEDRESKPTDNRLPDVGAEDAEGVAERLRSLAPGNRECAVAVATWNGIELPAALVGRAENQIELGRAAARAE